MSVREAHLETAVRALRGDHQGALQSVCRALVARGHAHARVVGLSTEDLECLATSGVSGTVDRALANNRKLRRALRSGERFLSGGLAASPLFARGVPAGAVVIELGERAEASVPAELEALLSAILEARSRRRELLRELRGARAEVRRHQAAEQHLLKRLALARHDLKAPLVPVKGYQDMMLRGMGGPLTDTQRRYVERSKASVDRLRDLIEYRLRNPPLPVVDLAQVTAQTLAAAPRPTRLESPEEPCWVLARPAALSAALTAWVRALGAATDGTISLRLRRGEEGWVISPGTALKTSLPARTKVRCAALFAECGGALLADATGGRAVLPFDPRVEVVTPDVPPAGHSPRSSSRVAAPRVAAADPG